MRLFKRDPGPASMRTTLNISFLCLGVMLCACHSKDNNQEPKGTAHARSFYARTGNSDRVIVFVHGISGVLPTHGIVLPTSVGRS